MQLLNLKEQAKKKEIQGEKEKQHHILIQKEINSKIKELNDLNIRYKEEKIEIEKDFIAFAQTTEKVKEKLLNEVASLNRKRENLLKPITEEKEELERIKLDTDNQIEEFKKIQEKANETLDNAVKASKDIEKEKTTLKRRQETQSKLTKESEENNEKSEKRKEKTKRLKKEFEAFVSDTTLRLYNEEQKLKLSNETLIVNQDSLKEQQAILAKDRIKLQSQRDAVTSIYKELGIK